MKLLKFLSVVFFLMIGLTAMQAACTVTTACGSTTYDTSDVSTSSSSSNGVLTVTVSSNGQVIDTITCNQGNSVSVSCEGEAGEPGEPGNDNGDFNFCDYVPDFLKGFFGCN